MIRTLWIAVSVAATFGLQGIAQAQGASLGTDTGATVRPGESGSATVDSGTTASGVVRKEGSEPDTSSSATRNTGGTVSGMTRGVEGSGPVDGLPAPSGNSPSAAGAGIGASGSGSAGAGR